MHKLPSNEKVSILLLQIAVPTDADPRLVEDEISAKLTFYGTNAPESSILDWRYASQEWIPVWLGSNPEEGEAFADSRVLVCWSEDNGTWTTHDFATQQERDAFVLGITKTCENLRHARPVILLDC